MLVDPPPKESPWDAKEACPHSLSSDSSHASPWSHAPSLHLPALENKRQGWSLAPLRVRLETAVPSGVWGRGRAQSPPQCSLPVPHFMLRSWRSRASSPHPKGQPPGPWINAACVCAADILLGHEHDFRVKHLSEALNDKHGPLAGEYRSPAPGRPLTLPTEQSPDGLFCSKDGPGLWPGSHSRLLWALGLLASCEMGVHAWLSGLAGEEPQLELGRQAGGQVVPRRRS